VPPMYYILFPITAAVVVVDFYDIPSVLYPTAIPVSIVIIDH